jgi:hypothetical protein
LSRCVQFLVAILFVAFFPGCDLVNLVQFRRQLRSAPPAYHKDASGQSVSIDFSEPMLAWDTLADAGIPLERKDGQTAVAFYILRITGHPDESYPVTFRFQNGRLKTVEMPAMVPELLGAKNIIAFFRLAAGAALAPDSFDDITAVGAEGVMAGHYGESVPLGLDFAVYLCAGRDDCRDILLKLERPDAGAAFKKITLRIKRPADM